MKPLQLPNPKSTKHTELYKAINVLIDKYNDEEHPMLVSGGASPSNKATKNTFKIVPSGRIDYCVDCDAEHRYDCPKAKPHWESDYAAIWEDRLMDEFCVMFERATRKDDTIDWVEKLERFIRKEIKESIREV